MQCLPNLDHSRWVSSFEPEATFGDDCLVERLLCTPVRLGNLQEPPKDGAKSMSPSCLLDGSVSCRSMGSWASKVSRPTTPKAPSTGSRSTRFALPAEDDDDYGGGGRARRQSG